MRGFLAGPATPHPVLRTPYALSPLSRGEGRKTACLWPTTIMSYPTLATSRRIRRAASVTLPMSR